MPCDSLIVAVWGFLSGPQTQTLWPQLPRSRWYGGGRESGKKENLERDLGPGRFPHSPWCRLQKPLAWRGVGRGASSGASLNVPRLPCSGPPDFTVAFWGLLDRYEVPCISGIYEQRQCTGISFSVFFFPPVQQRLVLKYLWLEEQDKKNKCGSLK